MVDLEHKLATTLIAAMFTQLLYGVALSQAIYYFWVYREDSPRFKYLVAWWLLLDTVKTGATLQVRAKMNEGMVVDRIACIGCMR
ncbi:hypothetical protein DAEQUDRAFT_815854 [Daedalea quercina L-15889]|uniref:Uncharacterized protein n=1 Tax=Daedalea quercina L-15889 TaxID=1314783 RepID=A0A165KEN4_9APHY|nr:hypothetical protein DAEQUDRAFT_815854 [Daedalea quercina L-15889]